MMEKKLDAKEARVQIWEELLRVAKPDSKFSWQFPSSFATMRAAKRARRC